MDDTFSQKPIGDLYGASLWIVRARWFYSVLAVLLGLVAIPTERYALDSRLLFLVGLFAVVANFALFLFLSRRDSEDVDETVLWRINVGQIVFDLSYVFVVLLISGGSLASFVHVFFFVPIIMSMILFGFRGAMTVAGFSSVFLMFASLEENGLVRELLVDPHAGLAMLRTPGELSHLTQTGVVVLIYLLIGFFSGTVARMLSEREAELHRRMLEQEATVYELSELTRDFEQSSKLLVRRDIELTMANERMMQLDRMKTEIISVAAHQLRTPLSGIKWMLKLLLDGDVGALNDRQRELVDRGFEANNHLVQLVNDLLAVDRLESGRVKYEFVSTSLCAVVDRAVGDLMSKATAHKVRLVSTCGPSVPKLPLDPERISDLVVNLIDNAIKYSHEGGEVRVVVERVDGGVRLSVKDSGIGIPEKDQAHIFSRFYRASNAMQHMTEGSGLGLSIVQSIALRHGGKIWFESREGEGTTFYVQLPYSLRAPEGLG